ncbi:hypothetical protein K3495_g3009 [Podosphaera aphanis]|nr:hypothetical protein K3495_g3009 [Podosphaera aphanis]
MSQLSSAPKDDDGADPFISQTNLSATAIPFRPKALPKAPFIKTSFPIPGTTQHLEQIIEANEALDDFGTFSTNTVESRNIKIFGGDGYDAAVHVEKAILKVRPYYKGTHRVVNTYPDTWLRCSNIRDAIKTYEAIRQECPELPSQYISYADWTKVVSPAAKASRSEHEGQVVVRVNFTLGVDRKQIEREVRNLLEEDGRRLYASQKMLATAAGVYQLIVEFEDATSAHDIILRLNRHVIAGGAIISINLHQPDLLHRQISNRNYTTPTRRQDSNTSNFEDNLTTGRISYPHHSSSLTSAYTSPVPHVADSSGFMFPPGSLPVISPSAVSPSRGCSLPAYMGINNFNNFMTPHRPHPSPGRSMTNSSQLTPFTPQSNGCGLVNRYKYESSMNRYNSTPRRNSLKVPHYLSMKSRPSNGTHNMVDINRIREGADVRTTIMLRNIPNKIDQSTLKSILDETSHGKYDFAYLRIDFSNDCNVGYAFVNFLDPLHIIEFINARANQKWYRFRSQKVAEVSYATIQGRDCLIQKFRNSCVMLELPIFRPKVSFLHQLGVKLTLKLKKLFYTFQDPLGRVGQEEPFPASDNPSKLRRSCENAEHVGLFAPNAGAQMRDEQRRRRSQYDRGTSLAERDAFDVYLADPWAFDVFETPYESPSF